MNTKRKELRERAEKRGASREMGAAAAKPNLQAVANKPGWIEISLGKFAGR
jgi:hypothetical protein